MATVVGGNGGRGFGVGQGRAANEAAQPSKDEKDKSASGKARTGEVGMKGEKEGEERRECTTCGVRERESMEHP